MKRRTLDEIRLKRERLLFAIEVSGARAIMDHQVFVRWMIKRDKPGMVLVRAALRDAGLVQRDIENLLGAGNHTKGCACWRCVLRLHAEIVKAASIRAQSFVVVQDVDQGSKDVPKPLVVASEIV